MKCLPARGHFSSEIGATEHCGGRCGSGLKFGDLAMEYAPGDTRRSASQRLKRWILRCADLYEALRAAGWRRGHRLLTPRQEALIRHYLGEP